MVDPARATEYEGVKASELRVDSFFAQLKIPASLLTGSSYATTHALPLTLRMRWVINHGSRCRAQERLDEIPLEILDACRYYKERDAVLLAACEKGASALPAYAGPLLRGARVPITAATRACPATQAIVRNERGANLVKWRRMSSALTSLFPGVHNSFECPCTTAAFSVEVSDDIGDVEAAMDAHCDEADE